MMIQPQRTQRSQKNSLCSLRLKTNLKLVIQIDGAFKIFRDEIYPNESDSVMCEIHKEFGSLDGTKHNCLGCNFADATMWIHNCLHTAMTSEPVSLEEFYFDYLL